MPPESLKYNPSHEWVSLTEENNQKIATVGVSAFAIEQLTDLVYMALPKVGSHVTAGSEFGEVESVKAVSPLYSPVTGVVIEVHAALVDQLETLGDDPYGNGWIIKVKVTDEASMSGLLDYAAYQRQCAEA